MTGPEPRSAQTLLGHPLGLIALGFGTGLSPLAPGTVASLAAWAVWRALPEAAALRLGVLGAFAVLALFAVRFALQRLRRRDPREVVADEWLGMWSAFAIVPSDAVGEGVAFLLFRLLDVLKPWPVSRLERLRGAFGVIADDLAAGLLAGGAVLTALWALARLQGG